MNYWLSHLPLEVWVDVYRYPWISREELGRIVDRFRNRKFAEFLQFYLHDWGKRMLKYSGLYKYVGRAQYRLHFPQTPIPANIKFFECIKISHFDGQVLNFLRQIGSILTNVNLNFIGISLINEMDNLRVIFANLLPLLDGIHSLGFDIRALPTVEQCFADKLAEIKVLVIYGYGLALDQADVRAQADVLHNLLISLTQDNHGPRFCRTVLSDALFEKILRAIRQQFLAAKTPRTFALELYLGHRYPAWQQFVEFHLTNNIGEEMHGVKKQDGCLVHITRHLTNYDKELDGWVEAKLAQTQHSRIEIYKPTIGSLDAMDAPVKEAEDDKDKPSTSKKA